MASHNTMYHTIKNVVLIWPQLYFQLIIVDTSA